MAVTKKHSNSPFTQDASRYFLPWMIMIMVFLASLSIALGVALNGLLQRWENSITGSLTIQVVPSSAEIANPDAFNRNIEATVAAIKQTPGVLDAKRLNRKQLEKLLSPWFSSNSLLFREIPMPEVIDVVLEDDIALDMNAVKSLLSGTLANASIDIHKAWLAKLTSFIKSIRTLAYAILLIVISSTVFIVIYATTTTVSLHKPVIELLHLIGASDAYIARRISARVLKLSASGAMFGLLMSFAALFLISYNLTSMERILQFVQQMGQNEILTVVLAGIAAVAIATLSAYITVMHKVKKML